MRFYDTKLTAVAFGWASVIIFKWTVFTTRLAEPSIVQNISENTSGFNKDTKMVRVRAETHWDDD